MPRNRSEKGPVYSATERVWLIARAAYYSPISSGSAKRESDAYHAMSHSEKDKWDRALHSTALKIGRQLRDAQKQK